MKRALNLLLGLAVLGPLFLTASSSKAYGLATDKTIVSRTDPGTPSGALLLSLGISQCFSYSSC